MARQKTKNQEYELSDSSRAMLKAGYTTAEVCALDHHKMIKFAEEYAKIMFANAGESLEIVRQS